DRHGLAARTTLNCGHPGKALDHGIVSGSIGHFPVRTEAMNRAIDNLGVHLAKICVADSETVSYARAVVLDDRAAFCAEDFDEIASVFFLEVDDDAALVAVKDQETGINPVLTGSSNTARRVALRRLDFDNVRTHITE